MILWGMLQVMNSFKNGFNPQNTVRNNDIVARLGGDEFAVLSIETNRENADKLATRIQTAIAKAGISAAIGFAMRNPTYGLSAAIIEADEKCIRIKP